MAPARPSPSFHRPRPGAFFAILTVAFAIVAIRMAAHPTAVFFGAAGLLLVYFRDDLRRVELARWATITFRDPARTTLHCGDRGGDRPPVGDRSG